MTKVKKKENIPSFLEAILSGETDLLTPVPVSDVTARVILIAAAMNMEDMVKESKINIGVDIISETPMGLIIKCRAEQPKEDKPYLFYFTYSVNSDKLKSWIGEHPYFDGMWKISSRGINISFSGGKAEDYHKALYFIECQESEESPEGLMYLDLLVKECMFAVHRDVFSNEEWVVSRVL